MELVIPLPQISIEQQTSSLVSDVSLMKQTLLNMEERNRKLEQVINNIATKHGINPDDVNMDETAI